ncbi:MAG: hypothetical protein KDC10_09380 [Calditrichaeota bacterium]|nr:hypothetical protein [Calditrichota bacterium]
MSSPPLFLVSALTTILLGVKAYALNISVPQDYENLWQAISVASSNGGIDSVFVDDGFYAVDNSHVEVGNYVLISKNGPQTTIIDGQSQYPGIELHGTISGFTIRNCINSEGKRYGAVFAGGSSMIRNCIIHDCVVTETDGYPVGSAIQCEGGDIDIINCLVFNCNGYPLNETGAINLVEASSQSAVRVTSSTILCEVSWTCFASWSIYDPGPFVLNSNIPCFGSQIIYSSCGDLVFVFSEDNCCNDLQFSQDGSYHLSEQSICIDSGDPELPLDPDGTRADAGAFYFCQGVGVQMPDQIQVVAEPGYPIQFSVTLQTTCDDVVIDSVSTTSQFFTVDQVSQVNLDSDYSSIEFHGIFSALQQGLYNDQLQIWTNGENSPLTVPLIGEAGPIPLPVTDLSISILSDDSARLEWSPVTETIYGNPVVPDYYLIFYNEQDPSFESDWYYLAPVVEPGYTHLLVSRFRELMSYRVVAWKGINPSSLGLEPGDPQQKLIELH